MNPTTLRTDLRDFRKARTTNSTDSSFPSRVATITQPASDGVIDLASLGHGGVTFNNLLLVPFGAGNDDQTFDLRVIGWRKIGSLWVPTILTQLSCTLSTAVGFAGTDVLSTERFADTLSIGGGGNANVDATVNSNALNLPAHATVDVKGCQLVEICFDMTGATSGNALYAPL